MPFDIIDDHESIIKMWIGAFVCRLSCNKSVKAANTVNGKRQTLRIQQIYIFKKDPAF